MKQSEWVVLGLGEDEIWEALEEAFTKKHGVTPDLATAILHGTAADDTERETSSLVYTARVLQEEYENAMLAKLIPACKEEPPELPEDGDP
jgi:hypothetical protein